MGQLVFYNAKVLLGGCDLSADLNQVTTALGAKMLNNSVFGDAFEDGTFTVEDASRHAGGGALLDETQSSCPRCYVSASRGCGAGGIRVRTTAKMSR